jgi:hypothetical protein
MLANLLQTSLLTDTGVLAAADFLGIRAAAVFLLLASLLLLAYLPLLTFRLFLQSCCYDIPSYGTF